MNYTRRQFIAKAGFGAAGVLAGVYNALNPDHFAPKERQLNKVPTPEEVVHIFQYASRGELMFYYSNFFKSFLLTSSLEAVELLRAASAKKHQIDNYRSHRLDVIPSVAAAHLLSEVINPDTKYSLVKLITNSLRDQRREVKEIIIENLITSTTVDYDTINNFEIFNSILEVGKELVSDCYNSEKLLLPLCLFVQYLLNAQLFLRAQKKDHPSLIKVNEILNPLIV